MEAKVLRRLSKPRSPVFTGLVGSLGESFGAFQSLLGPLGTDLGLRNCSRTYCEQDEANHAH